MYPQDLSKVCYQQATETVFGTPYAEKKVRWVFYASEPVVVCGMTDVRRLLERHCRRPVVARGLAEGTFVQAGQVLLTVEGYFTELAGRATEISSLLSMSGAANAMAERVEAAGELPVIETGSGSYPPELIPRIAVAAAVGGARGTDTPAGFAEVQSRFGLGGGRIRIAHKEPAKFKLYGGVGHALNALYGDSMKSVTAFDEAHPKGPLMISVDYEGRERDVCAEAVGQYAYELKAIYLDVPSTRMIQGGHEKPTRTLEMRILSQASDRAIAIEALDKYGFGPGLTIEAAYIIRDVLDSLGGKSVQIIAAGRFDADKIRAFQACQAPIDAVTTGGDWLRFANISSTITEVEEEGEWKSVLRAGVTENIQQFAALPVLFEKTEA